MPERMHATPWPRFPRCRRTARAADARAGPRVTAVNPGRHRADYGALALVFKMDPVSGGGHGCHARSGGERRAPGEDGEAPPHTRVILRVRAQCVLWARVRA